MEAVIVFITPLIQSLAVKYPVIVAIFAVMGTMRVMFKPIMALLHTYVLATASKSDDLLLKKFEEGKVYKVIKFLVDYIFSIKIGKQK